MREREREPTFKSNNNLIFVMSLASSQMNGKLIESLQRNEYVWDHA